MQQQFRDALKATPVLRLPLEQGQGAYAICLEGPPGQRAAASRTTRRFEPQRGNKLSAVWTGSLGSCNACPSIILADLVHRPGSRKRQAMGSRQRCGVTDKARAGARLGLALRSLRRNTDQLFGLSNNPCVGRSKGARAIPRVAKRRGSGRQLTACLVLLLRPA